MNRVKILLICGMVAWFTHSSTDTADAGGRCYRTGYSYHLRMSPYRPYPYSNYGYEAPRYYGGFHVRYFQDIGIPSGDIGIRGNGFYSLPW